MLHRYLSFLQDRLLCSITSQWYIILNCFLCAAFGWLEHITGKHSTVMLLNLKIQFAVLGLLFSMSLTAVVFSKLSDASDLYKALGQAELISVGDLLLEIMCSSIASQTERKILPRKTRDHHWQVKSNPGYHTGQWHRQRPAIHTVLFQSLLCRYWYWCIW